MGRSAVQVFLRTRSASGPNPHLQLPGDNKTVVLSIPKDHRSASGQGQAGGGNQYQFKFDGVLHEAPQEAVYETCAGDVLKSALEGFNATIMCYGQTGAGKTYTMSGGRQGFKERGIIPRTLAALFGILKQRTNQETRVTISYMEIYNEQLYDLLDMTTQPYEIQIQDLSAARAAAYLTRGPPPGMGTVRVTGLRSVTVDSEAEALQLLFEGETNRVIGEHQLNRESSRSHSIFQISLETRTKDDPMGVVIASKLSLVDLAGSERVSKTRSEGVILKEAGHINKSLSILEQVIVALGDKGRDHVPFRSTRLTHVLKDSLGGNCATVLIANVWGEADQIDETLSTCRFAQRMMRVTCEVTPNVVEDNSAKVKQLQRQITELQQELAMHDSMSGRQGIQYAPYSAEQRAMLQSQIDLFLDSDEPDTISPLELISLRHMREILLSLRSRVKTRLADADQLMQEARTLAATRPAVAPPAAGAAAAEPLSPTSALEARLAAPDHVGPPGPADSTGGGNTGDVSASASGAGDRSAGQSASVSAARQAAVTGGAGVGVSTLGRDGEGGGTPRRTSTTTVPDTQQAFEQFKSGPGAVKSGLLETNRTRLKAVKKKAKELGLSINALKKDLDEAKASSDTHKAARQAAGGDAPQVLSEEELQTLNRIKECKKQYKDQFSEFQMVKSEVDYTQQLCDTCSKEIIADFQTWYESQYGVVVANTSDLPTTHNTTTDSALSPTAHTDPSDTLPSPSAQSQASSSTTQHATNQAPRKGATAPAAAQKPGAAAMATKRSPGGAAAAAAAAVPAPPKPEPGELNDPEAAAFYSAQQAMMAKTQGVLHRPGSFKKKTGPDTTFSHTNRSDIAMKTTAEAFLKPEARRESPRTNP